MRGPAFVHEGRTEPAVRVNEVVPGPHAFALGALSELLSLFACGDDGTAGTAGATTSTTSTAGVTTTATSGTSSTSETPTTGTGGGGSDSDTGSSGGPTTATTGTTATTDTTETTGTASTGLDTTDGSSSSTTGEPEPCACPDIEVPLDDGIFILSDSAELWKYFPAGNNFEMLGQINCPGQFSTFSMAVDRQGFAWVQFNLNGELRKVDVTNVANCTDPGYSPGQVGVTNLAWPSCRTRSPTPATGSTATRTAASAATPRASTSATSSPSIRTR